MRIITLLTILSLAPLNVSAQSRLPFHFEFVPHMSMMNSATGGNIDAWWNETTGVSNHPLGDSAKELFAADASILFRMGDKLLLGVGVTVMPEGFNSHWGFHPVISTYQIINIMTTINAIKFPIKYRRPAYKELSIVVTPSLLSGTMHGSYDDLGSIHSIPDTRSVGFGLEAGMDVYFNNYLGIYLRAGVRSLIFDMVWDDETAATLGSGDTISVGVGGPYITLGVTMRLAI